ncbi:SDR family oxidoreductase [Saccharibacillus sp. CPCC 101409]|uniref:SDR family NAD(P)-dependent oxidoreductase n=1 Tax=Saccharibacillus sp. CPCC 101409 TaxID=3058041 RepID=UPI002672B07C|nr:SDR family oxidoreductase [Saccharibacillus sp. CPCC 101409]MDO3411225.1 SDR family oxidoreductase [Saccharibacillus sp. CPCC 101409]
MYKGQTALIMGASSGIGAAFAGELARKGMNLIVVARSGDKLQRLAEDLSARHGVQVDVIIADLSDEQTALGVYDEVKRRRLQVDLLVNNAGVASYGFFDKLSLKKQEDEIRLNVLTVVSLTHHFLQDMLERRRGAVINVASASGFQPTPFMAVYGATKAFMISWSEALWAETKDKGVSVVALCPGRTATNIQEVMGVGAVGPGKDVSPEQVVRTGLRALEKGKMTVVDGRGNYWTAQIARIFPRKFVVGIAYRIFRKNSSGAA